MASNAHRAWFMTALGTSINLCFVPYSWSVIKGEISKQLQAGNPEWDWDVASLNAPYSASFFVAACSSYPAGYFYDKFGPRGVTTLGAALVSMGLFACSLSSALSVWILGFGFLMSAGFGVTYAVQTPMAMTWFPSSKAGLIAAIVQNGAALSPLYLSPMMLLLIREFGLLLTMRYLSIFYLVILVTLAQFLKLPPPEVQATPPEPGGSQSGKTPSFDRLPATHVDFTLAEALRTRALYLSTFGFFLGAGVGIMMIAEAVNLANRALGEHAWISLEVMSLGNGSGRVAAGIMNDKFGVRKALCFFYSFQAFMMLTLIWVPKDSATGVLAVATLIGFNYGAHPCLWSVATKFFYGKKAYGQIFGVIVLGWGGGGMVLSNIGQVLNESTGSIDSSAIMGLILLMIGLISTLFLQTPVKEEAATNMSSQLADSSFTN